MGAPPPVRAVSSVDTAAAALRSWIANGALKPGERIKEIPIAEELELKRGAIREALRVLAEEGLVTLVVNQGARVAEVRSSDLMELYALRLALGNLAIRHVIEQQADLEEVQAVLQALSQAVARKRSAKVIELDFALQDALVRASGLERVATVFARTTLQLTSALGAVAFDFRPALTSVHEENVQLIDAVVSGDSGRATAAWQGRLERWVRSFVTQIDEDFDAERWLTLYARALP